MKLSRLFCKLMFTFSALALALVLSSCKGEVKIATSDMPFSGIIVYDGESDTAKSAANAFRLRLNELGLANLHSAYSAGSMSGELEIIFGNTDRDVSRDAVKALNSNAEGAPDDFHWEYRYKNGRLAIVASDEFAYDRAIEYFFDTYYRSGELKVPEGMKVSRSYSKAEYESLFNMPKNENFDDTGLIYAAPIPDLGERYDAGQGAYTYIKKDADVYAFHDLLDGLEELGYKYYTGNAIGKNLYATYLTRTQIVHLMFFYETGEIRTSVDPRGEGLDGFSIAGLSGENVYERIGKSGMTFVEIENADWPGGMCMIFKLADGSFFVIDSGVGGRDNDGSSSGWVYATLAKHADDPENIRVSTWLITHIHSDHAGGLLDLARGWYESGDGRHNVMPEGAKDKIQINRIIYNQPADMSKFGRSGWMTEIIEAFDVKNVVKAHPGQEFFIADLTLTVYGSQDLLIEKSGKIDSHNEQCVVTKIDFNGKTLLSLADSETWENERLADIYGESLKSDIIQTAHHGYGNTGAKEVNELCNPDIVLWPVATYEMVDANVKTHPINAIFLDKQNYAPHGGNVDFDENWVAGDPYSVLELIPDCSCGCGKKSSWRE